MKVLKSGNGMKEWSKQVVCTGKGNGGGGCGAELLIGLSDLFHTYASYMGREEEWFVTFACVECAVLTDVKGAPVQARDLPSRVAHKEGRRYKLT